MSQPSNMTDEERKSAITKLIDQSPAEISLGIREKILARQVVTGMSPYEAYLAGGAFSFKVVPDKKKWPKDANPYSVMWAQSSNPDESYISMRFENSTQYPEKGQAQFKVSFREGRAVEILVTKEEPDE